MKHRIFFVSIAWFVVTLPLIWWLGNSGPSVIENPVGQGIQYSFGSGFPISSYYGVYDECASGQGCLSEFGPDLGNTLLNLVILFMVDIVGYILILLMLRRRRVQQQLRQKLKTE